MTTLSKDEVNAMVSACRNGQGPVDMHLFAALAAGQQYLKENRK